MNRHDFLQELRTVLSGQVPEQMIQENINYYDTYINNEVQKGSSEDEVIASLGSPRLLARTIIDAYTMSADDEKSQSTAQADTSYQRYNANTDHNNKGFNAKIDENGKWDFRYGRFKLNSWYAFLLLFVILVSILVVVANIFIALLPILIPVFLVLFIASVFFGRK